MLRRVEIHNYKSCREVVLDALTPLVALVGRNGSGKTNVLKAIETAARSASRLSGDFDQFAWVQPDTRVSFEFGVGESEYRYTLAHLSAAPAAEGERQAVAAMAARDAWGPPLFERLEMRSGEDWRTLVERRDEEVALGSEPGLRLGRAAPVLPWLRAMLSSRHPALAGVAEARTFLAGVRYYDLTGQEGADTSSLITHTAYLQWRQKHEAGERPGPAAMKVLHVALTQPERFEELQSLLGPNGLELIERVQIDEPGRGDPIEDFLASGLKGGYDRYVRFVLPHGVFAFRDLSAGTRRIISLLASLLLDDSGVLLVEHPEDGIHPGLVYKVIGLLHAYTDPATIFLTTHSTMVMDNLRPEECRLVSMSEGATDVRALSARELARVHAYLKETGPLSDFIELAEQD
jgi:energy-coupling factor transporter ATP-binding protein EcfA2